MTFLFVFNLLVVCQQLTTTFKTIALIGSQDTRDALNSLLHQTGSCSRDFMLVLATNRAEDLDEAVLDRMVSHGNVSDGCVCMIRNAQVMLCYHVVLDATTPIFPTLSCTG